MSGIYIKRMEMPKEGHLIVRIYADGKVCEPTECAGVWRGVATAVPVPPHGRCVDADAYRAEMKQRQDACAEWRDNAIADGDSETYHRADGALSVFCEAKLTLDKMPTIIPAEEGE